MRVKKLLSSILAICMILSTMTFTAFAGSIDSDIDTAITLAENTEIANAVTLSETITVLGDVTISGGGSITRAEGMTAPMFIVEAGSTLTLENITIDGGAVWAYEVSEDEPTKAEKVINRGSVNTGVVASANVIENSGTVIIGELAVIENNDGGVAVNAKNGSTTTISGGEIRNITAGAGSAVLAGDTNTTALIEMNDGKISGNITGGGVFWHRGPAIVDGGEICNNYSTGSAGIFRMATGNNLRVTINGGKIHHNEANGAGGVIYSYGKAIIEINGGEISDNKATDGGAIYGSAAKSSSLVINDGLITRNYASSTAGAIHLADWWTFQLNGGEISYNETPGLGGAFRQWASWGTSFNGGVVKDNVAGAGEAIWMGNGLYLSGTVFENNDIYTTEYISVNEEFEPFELSGDQTADVRGYDGYELTEDDLAKISVNSLGKFPYYDEATKHVIFVDEYVIILKDGEQLQVKSIEQAIELSEEGDKIVLLSDVSDKNLTINKNIDIVSESRTRTLPVLNNVVFTVEKDAALSLDGFAIEGLSYIYAKEPESVSVSNCNINVGTVEVSGTNCPPAFVLFSSSNNGSVEFVFTNNILLAAPDVTEDWYTYTHGIAGWNSIESATITGNTFGSAEAPLGAAAVKLMNFVDGAEVTVSENTFYVNSKDSTWGPDAIQFYQNNSRANNYTATISDNDFYVDDATAAIGINTNAMGKPVEYAGGGHVAIGKDNTVNDQPISISDVLVFGNGINDEAYTRGYVGVDVEFDANGKIIGGEFSEYSLGLESALADGYATETDVAGNLSVVEETLLVDEIKVEFALASETEGEKVYNINLTADGNTINRLNSVDLTFLFSQIEGDNEYEIIASNEEVAINPVDNSKVRYEFHYNGKTDVATDTNVSITLGQVKFTAYGKFSFAVDANANNTNAAHATKLFDNIVDTFIPNGNVANGEGVLDVSDNTITDVEIAVPVRTLTINLDFPNAVEDNKIAYQDMKVEITGTIDGVNKTVVYNLGEDEVAMVDGSYVVTEDKLVLNNAYTVTVSGAGYRTARYTVTMTDDKQLNFWNNVMDEAQIVEIGKDSSVAKVTFLAGDIVKDNNINIYDLSAVVSYFGTTTDVSAYSDYAKYDLNRDGVIDSKDVAYVLVSWNN